MLWDGWNLVGCVLTNMRLSPLLFTAILIASPARAQQPTPSPASDPASAAPDVHLNLPVSIDKIREALAQPAPALSLRTIDERPSFRLQIFERQKIEELLASLNFKAGPVPAGGVYMAEQQRLMFNPVDRPLMQQFGAFNQGELLTLLVENLVGKYLAGRAGNAVSKLERERAESNAREEVRAAVGQYCNAQPNAGVGIQICSSLDR
jgi:hypothetical protein